MDGFVGEIRLFTMSWVPRNWLPCNGQTLTISQNQVLFSLIGNLYGGDGRTTFKLPDLRGRVAIGTVVPTAPTSAHPLGEYEGGETSAIPASIVPLHNHTLRVSSATSGNAGPANNFPGASLLLTNGNNAGNVYVTASATGRTPINANTVVPGNGVPAPNVQPSVVLNYCICANGLYPSRG
ncbi:tail fiber protein [Pseudomonas fakonensis]|uniref:Tail fiber protein n=1 Tax=Pseudomonas fakonensis TaxID=2842355 RepID=A0ABX8NBN2_9PSED|nr:tail fiber protein [Pseudomonas fakonensis]QXH53761.1 tail fiber protein [Pseudomonas fakonensis]